MFPFYFRFYLKGQKYETRLNTFYIYWFNKNEIKSFNYNSSMLKNDTLKQFVVVKNVQPALTTMCSSVKTTLALCKSKEHGCMGGRGKRRQGFSLCTMDFSM